MNNRPIRVLLSIVSLFSIVLASSAIRAGSIKMSDVIQVVSSNPTKLYKGSFTELRIEPQNEPKNGNPQPQQTPPATPRIQTEEVVEITEEACDCPDLPVPPPVRARGGFPWWVLGFGAVPLIFLCCDDN